jgi:hypothetical protein
MMQYETPQQIVFEWADKQYSGIIFEDSKFPSGYAIAFGIFSENATSRVDLGFATRKWTKEQLETIKKL